MKAGEGSWLVSNMHRYGRQPMHDHLIEMYNRDASSRGEAEYDVPESISEGLTYENHDVGKARATVAQYVAIVGGEVVVNFETLACARVERPRKRKDDDAHVQEAHQKFTSGGGQDSGDVDEDGDAQVAGPTITLERHFPPILWDFSSEEDMPACLAFEKRSRLITFSKGLLKLRCMDTALENPKIAMRAIYVEQKRNYEELHNLAEDNRAEYDALVRHHTDKAETNAKENNIEFGVAISTRTTGLLPNLHPDATFAAQTGYEFPNQFIRDLLAAIPP